MIWIAPSEKDTATEIQNIQGLCEQVPQHRKVWCALRDRRSSLILLKSHWRRHDSSMQLTRRFLLSVVASVLVAGCGSRSLSGAEADQGTVAIGTRVEMF
ncbi:MAG: hypothetical protein AAB380_00395, partial [Verrucomicrobiota bacterium]